MLSILRNKNEIDLEKYFIVKYFLESKTTLEDAAWNLAIGQSVGNPKVRNNWETSFLGKGLGTGRSHSPRFWCFFKFFCDSE